MGIGDGGVSSVSGVRRRCCCWLRWPLAVAREGCKYRRMTLGVRLGQVTKKFRSAASRNVLILGLKAAAWSH